MPFADLALSRRLERAEGYACAQFAEARRRLFPNSGAEWLECAGAFAVFDGVDSPVTQSFGLGIFEELHPDVLNAIEHFFFARGAQVHHEISPLAGIGVLEMLCSRRYRPIEISSVLFREIEQPVDEINSGITVRLIDSSEAQVWSETSARGWTHEHPELREFLRQLGTICTARNSSPCFLAELDGQPGAAGVLCIHQGVALFAGAATIPELRCRGLQKALFHARMHYAFSQGCDLAMVATEPGSASQRNAERNGFRLAYTRTKWQLSSGH